MCYFIKRTQKYTKLFFYHYLYHEDIIKLFAKEVRNIITMMVNLRKENIELTKQRDELLPLLMNGQATVNYHLSDD